jgi:hypothetical protein
MGGIDEQVEEEMVEEVKEDINEDNGGLKRRRRGSPESERRIQIGKTKSYRNKVRSTIITIITLVKAFISCHLSYC